MTYVNLEIELLCQGYQTLAQRGVHKTKNQIQRIPINICLFLKIGIFPEIQSKHSSTRRAEKIISYLLKSKFQTSEWTCNLGLIT